MTQKCRTGESHGTLGQNFSKKVFEKFRKGDKRKNLELHISLHRSTVGQNFSIFKKLEKFIQRYILGQIFPFLSKENWKNSKSYPNGPREGIRPKDNRNGPREGVRPKDNRNGPRKGVRPKIY